MTLIADVKAENRTEWNYMTTTAQAAPEAADVVFPLLICVLS